MTDAQINKIICLLRKADKASARMCGRLLSTDKRKIAARTRAAEAMAAAAFQLVRLMHDAENAGMKSTKK